MSFSLCSLSELCKYKISLIRDMCAVAINKLTAAIPCKHVKGRQGEQSWTNIDGKHIKEPEQTSMFLLSTHVVGLAFYPCVFVCVN